MNAAENLVQTLLESQPLLVIVHPGSLCGSYHSSGNFDQNSLKALLQEIEDWTGDCAIIHGTLSDELEDYPDVRNAIEARIDFSAEEYDAEGTDDDLSAAAEAIAADFNVKTRPNVLVTGAWADAASGCVTYVASELQRLGAKVAVSKYAAKDG